MGREIRRVPPDWEHPIYTEDGETHFQPMCDQLWDDAIRDWLNQKALWDKGEHEWQKKHPEDRQATFDDVEGTRPDSRYYRQRPWTAEEATAVQMYETVSEGTPVSPVCKTKEELVEYLVANGDQWRGNGHGNGKWDRAAAEAFVSHGSVPSMIVVRSAHEVKILSPRDAEFYTKGEKCP